MLELFRAKIHELFPKVKGPVDFLKFNTAGSVSGRHQKVIFLAFAPGAALPFLCIKTVRRKERNDDIVRSFESLKKLYEPLRGTPHESVVPKPIGIFEADGIAYSIESAQHGRRPTFADVPLILSQYIAWQTRYKQGGHSGEHGGYVDEQGGNGKLQHQHGDMTLDNIMLGHGDTFHVFDCDNFAGIHVPGFDIYHLLLRIPGGVVIYKNYFERYFEAIGMSDKTFESMLPYYEEAEKLFKNSNKNEKSM